MSLVSQLQPGGGGGRVVLLLRSKANLNSLSQTLQLRSPRRLFSASKPLSSDGHWSNESPSGGLTEVYVYHKNSKTVWPDPGLGLFSPVDPKFSFPGLVGLGGDPHPRERNKELKDSSQPDVKPTASKSASASDLLSRPTNIENQAQVLYSANDYIQYMADAEANVCADVLEEFPRLRGMSQLCCEVHEAPQLLRKEIQPLFVGTDVLSTPLSVVTMSQRTKNDMSVWSGEMEEEREKLTEHFVTAAKEICARLKSEGYWADFIDPSAGTPFYGPPSSTTMFETDEKYRLLGFRIEDLGCCKVISHREFGRNVFVGTIFTNAANSTGIVEDIFQELKLSLNQSESIQVGDDHTGVASLQV